VSLPSKPTQLCTAIIAGKSLPATPFAYQARLDRLHLIKGGLCTLCAAQPHSALRR
jgi:hypothetical protein